MSKTMISKVLHVYYILKRTLSDECLVYRCLLINFLKLNIGRRKRYNLLPRNSIKIHYHVQYIIVG